jgi:hypothetical protein
MTATELKNATKTDLSTKLINNLIKLVGEAKTKQMIADRKAAKKEHAELVACGWAK